MTDSRNDYDSIGQDEEKPDTRGPAVLVSGNLFAGFKFYGPFATVDDADRWHSKQTLSGSLGIEACIVLLDDVDSYPGRLVTADGRGGRR